MRSLRQARLEERVAEIRPQLQKARELAEKADAEHREMTEAEQKEYDEIMAKGRAVSEAVRQHRHDESVWAFAKEEFGGGDGSSPTAKAGQRLSFKRMGTKAATAMLPDGVKSLAPSGAAVVDQEFKPDPIALGQVATGLLDVLPVVQHTTPEYSYLAQKTRTNNAAVVAEGATKPTSVYSVVRVEKSLVVVAHFSEAVPRYWLLDNIALEAFVDNELRYGLTLSVEAKVLADVNGTSGIQSQAYATSLLTTLRKGLTKLETAGYTPSSVVLHPTDWEGVELALCSTNAIEHLSLPYDPASRRLFGVPIVATVNQAAGVGHVLAADAVVVDTDTRGVDVQWSETSNSDDFAKNLIRARCEGRFETSVLSRWVW